MRVAYLERELQDIQQKLAEAEARLRKGLAVARSGRTSDGLLMIEGVANDLGPF